MIPGGTNILTRMCPAKEDIIWRNLNVEASTRKFLKGLVIVLYIVLIIFFTPCMVLVQSLVNLDELRHSGFPGLTWVDTLDERLKSTIEGLVPVLLFSIFFILLPSILFWMVGLTVTLTYVE